MTTTRVGKVELPEIQGKKTTTENAADTTERPTPLPPPTETNKGYRRSPPWLPISGGMQIGLDWLTWVRMDPIGVDGFRGGLAVALGRQRAEPVHSDGGGYAGHSRGTDARGSTGACATRMNGETSKKGERSVSGVPLLVSLGVASDYIQDPRVKIDMSRMRYLKTQPWPRSSCEVTVVLNSHGVTGVHADYNKNAALIQYVAGCIYISAVE